MKTFVLQKPFQFAAETRLFDDNLAADEALVKIHRVGICGTDYHAYRGRQPFFDYPRVLGHELGGEIVKIGSYAEGVSVGDKVSVEPYLHCGKCQSCRNGKSNCCENLRVLGVHTDGGMTEFVKLPISKLHVSNQLSYEQLALVETLGIGAHAVQRAAPTAHDLVLVIGAGPIGLSVVQFAQATGATVAIVDTNAQRLAFAERLFNPHATIPAQADFSPEILRGHLNGDLPTVVFDATGNPQSMQKAFEFVGFGGKLVFVGLFIGDVTFYDPLFHRREMTLLASRNSLPQDFKRIISLMESGQIDTNAWITHRAAFDDLPVVFDTWLQPDSGVVKAVLELS